MVVRHQLEIEAKIAVVNLATIEDILTRLGATRIGKYLETDTFFDNAENGLRENQSALRLRDRSNAETGVSNFRLTFKGPRQGGAFKQRREIEIAVDNHANTRDLLEMLGFHSFVSYTKRRNSWAYENCTVEVDEIEGIGRFVEVEGPDEESIRRVLARLSLENEPVIHESYLAMVMGKRKPPI